MFVYNCQQLYVIFSFHNQIINGANNKEHHLGSGYTYLLIEKKHYFTSFIKKNDYILQFY